MSNGHNWLTRTFPGVCDGCPERNRTEEPRHARSNGETDVINFHLDVETHNRLLRLTGEDQANTSKADILRAALDLALPIFEEKPGMVRILRQSLKQK